jgi:hypothetical protein
MKAYAVAILLLLPATDAGAISRYMSTSMTCAAVQAKVAQEGAVILRHRSARTGILLYDRYVKNRLFCPVGQTTEWKSVPTTDRPACRVYRCREVELPDFR